MPIRGPKEVANTAMLWFSYDVFFRWAYRGNAPEFLRRMLRRGGYRRGFLQRFGWYRGRRPACGEGPRVDPRRQRGGVYVARASWRAGAGAPDALRADHQHLHRPRSAERACTRTTCCCTSRWTSRR